CSCNGIIVWNICARFRQRFLHLSQRSILLLYESSPEIPSSFLHATMNCLQSWFERASPNDENNCTNCCLRKRPIGTKPRRRWVSAPRRGPKSYRCSNGLV